MSPLPKTPRAPILFAQNPDFYSLHSPQPLCSARASVLAASAARKAEALTRLSSQGTFLLAASLTWLCSLASASEGL